MTPDFLRDAAGTAAVFGFFAMAWFGWAQEAPPAKWLWPLRIGSILSGLTAVAGGLLLWRHWSDGSVIDASVGPKFGIIVGVEFALAGLGCGLLAWRKRADLMSAWIAFVVGVHFFPVAVLLEIPALHVTAALVTVASIASVFIAKARSLTVSAVVGATTGPILLASGLLALADALTR
ncbi:hypothetical protein SAMN05216298_3964 [Glycomyces sambucus]|uniref:Uncharacterized protein n=1 Tax=Glycomyces sambucus TaxID=380244 RepID=A0A1G9KC40_9ACTN|nr:hypothetical protein [Glycomyces sambucus]SDL47004.1 hypothetical protein SAMN05216298_3964 [Glycomyces sambucus]